MKVWVVGMMGSGKTTAGRLAASNLGTGFTDTDDLVAERAGRPIADVWAEEGEQAFRALEKMVVAGLAGYEGIVATGGGAVVDEDNRSVLSSTGTVVWIDAAPTTLARRIGADPARPLVAASGGDPQAVLTETLSRRRAFYELVADHRIVADDLDVVETARRIEETWKF